MRALDALFVAIRVAHAKDVVTCALATWETWIVVASASYIAGHLAYWGRWAFGVLGQ